MTDIQKAQVGYLAALIETLDEAEPGFLVPESMLFLPFEANGVKLGQFKMLVGGVLGGGLAERCGADRLQITPAGREVAAKIRAAKAGA